MIQHFRRTFPATKIIAMGEIDDTLYLDTARRLGAHSALLKPLRRDEFLEAIAQQISPAHMEKAQP